MALATRPAHAQNADGKTLYLSKACATCHGPEGRIPLQPAYPKLTGQNAAYLTAQMLAFKKRTRTNGQSALMWGMAETLSDAEIRLISEYLASLK